MKRATKHYGFSFLTRGCARHRHHGPAGSGKSTVTGHVAVQFAAQGFRVGVIAIDPTSMRGKGALLGDRVRMKEAERLVASSSALWPTRGYPGGVARAATGAVYVLRGWKEPYHRRERRCGQSDKALFFLADTIITLLTPDYGDEIQC